MYLRFASVRLSLNNQPEIKISSLKKEKNDYLLWFKF